ncbi:MAG: CapA family protein [Alphaproteobacteria bacterium]|nr:CapA family protein [Alphaproteobacteria bacterium]
MSLCAALLSSCSQGQWGVTIWVLDEDGAALPGAWVVLDGETHRTDAEGMVRLGHLSRPSLLQVGAEGHLSEPVPLGPDDDDAVVPVTLWSDARVALHFGGDVMLGRRYQAPPDGAARIPSEQAYEAALELLTPLGEAFALADRRVINLETVVGEFSVNEAVLDASLPNTPDDEQPYPGKRWVMQTPPGAVEGALAALSVDEVVLANNHQQDWEAAGVLSTLGALGCLDAASLEEDLCLGGGLDAEQAAAPSRARVKGLEIGALAYTSVNGDYVNDQYPAEPDADPPADEAWMHLRAYWGEPELGVPLDLYSIGEAWAALQDAEPSLDEAEAAALWESARAVYPGLQDWVARRGHGGANPWDAERARAEIRALSQESELTVVQLHMGYQFSQSPSAGLREAAEVAAESGADLVIAHHPHVLQGVEWMGDTLVVWSLGNLAFDQDFLATFPSAFLRVIVDEDGALLEARLIPLRIDAYQPVPVVGERAKLVLDHVLEASLRPGVAWREDDRSITEAQLSEAPSELAGLTFEQGGARITREDPALSELMEDTELRLGATPLALDAGVCAGPQSLELGRPLLWALGDFEDRDTDAEDEDVDAWHIIGADDGVTDRDAASGLRSLELIADPDQSSASAGRLVARTPLPAHRLFDEDGQPLDGEARYAVHLQAWADGERDKGRVRIALYDFDDLDPLVLPSSAELGDVLLPFTLEGSGWHELWLELPEDALAPVQGLTPNMGLVYVELTPPERTSTLLRVDDVELVEWRAAGPEPRVARWARGPAGAYTLSCAEVGR